MHHKQPTVPDSFIHELATFVHGSLVALHTLGVVYGIRRKNWCDVAAHSFGVAFSVRATAHHIKRAKAVEVNCESKA